MASDPKPTCATGWKFGVWQYGQKVASGFAPDEATADREANHYATMYAQDGPIDHIQVAPVRRRKPKELPDNG